MKYYYLKIGHGNTLAKDWLEGRNKIGKPAAVVFFGKTRVKNLLKGTGPKQAIDFCRAGLPENHRGVLAVVITEGDVWITRPASAVREILQDNRDIWKAMEVRVLKRVPLADVPHVLASIGTNRYLSSGTFREITQLGNIKAIRRVLGKPLSRRHYSSKMLDSKHLLQCLSSVELETLVAKLLESRGCFVPAYRGGYMKDVDLFASNDTRRQLDVGGLRIGKGGSVSIQVKLHAEKHDYAGADYAVVLDAEESHRVFNADWLMKQIIGNPPVRKWLARSLRWLPQEYLGCYGLLRR